MHNTQILLRSTPKGELSLSNFETIEAPIPQAESGQVVVKNLLISQDAANRAWIRGPSYRKAVKIGDVMHAYTIGEVTQSDDPNLSVGTRVFGEGGWQNFYVSRPEKLSRVRGDVPLSHLFTLVGIAGKTAYHGLVSVGELKRGDVLVVSAAAGSVGIFAGQIGKAMGCKVIGIAGGSQKCEWLVNQLKFDCAVDYKSDSFGSDLGAACGDGVDVFFDNVGGDVCSTVLPLMNLHSRIVCCGAISQYDGGTAASPVGLPGLLVSKRIRMEGFIVFDFADQDEAAEEALLAWAEAGEIKVVEDVINGLENAPRGLIGLLAGENVGKRMILI
jgi:NADPH-dependent curcumin reductase CurA